MGNGDPFSGGADAAPGSADATPGTAADPGPDGGDDGAAALEGCGDVTADPGLAVTLVEPHAPTANTTAATMTSAAAGWRPAACRGLVGRR